MNANDYKQILINAYKNQELSVEDFENTLAHFAGLCVNESNQWVKVEEELSEPLNELETVWISNGKGWTTLGCLVYSDGGWHWAETNGVIYEKDGKIISECESDDLDVRFWHRAPKPPCL